jgi:carbon storage regulator
MLVISRKSGESVLIGDKIEIHILEVGDGIIKIGINAPKEIKILRKEIYSEVKNENIESMKISKEILNKIKSK